MHICLKIALHNTYQSMRPSQIGTSQSQTFIYNLTNIALSSQNVLHYCTLKTLLWIYFVMGYPIIMHRYKTWHGNQI